MIRPHRSSSHSSTATFTTRTIWSSGSPSWSVSAKRVTVYPDAEEFIQQRLFQTRIKSLVDEIRRDPARHPLRKQLLKTELLPYQLDGIAFAVGAGRAVLADDMGLGKTIQGVGVAELLAQQAGIRKVLVICPTSLKSQWRSEIERFSDRSCQLVLGAMAERPAQYDNDAFFTVCNYEQVLRDLLAVERVKWDLIILDEGQRIKNWEAKTTHVVKRLKSPFALVLSGTPLENRIDELYSVVQFVDDRRLGPRVSVLQSPSRRRREGQSARLQEPGPAPAAPGADSAAPYARASPDAIARSDDGDRADRTHGRAVGHSRRPDENRRLDRP